MDIEHLTHRGQRLSLAIAVVLSCMAVTLASLIGRGTLNLSGALLLTEPRDTTVIALVEPKLQEKITISGIIFLRKEDPMPGEKPTYTYHVRTSDESDYFVRLRFDTTSSQWALERLEKLYGSVDRTHSAP